MNAFNQPQKPDCLYYGSSERFDVIPPSQEHDFKRQDGSRSAVYATSIRDIALACALGVVPDENGQYDRVLSNKYGVGISMIFHKGRPNFGAKGYLYELPAKDFTCEGGTWWVSPSPVTPLKINEINVDDFLYLFRYATEEEKKHIDEDFSER